MPALLADIAALTIDNVSVREQEFKNIFVALNVLK